MLSEFEKKVADFVQINGFFGPASAGHLTVERVLLAVSGGADSTALLHCVRHLSDEGVFNAQLLCAHINHQLRGDEADLDEQFVVAQASELNLPVIVRRVDVCEFARQNKLSIETSARKLRLESLLEIAKANNCFFIATAHQKNDNAETIIHRLLRGTGFRGLAGIRPVQDFEDVKFVRPLLCVRRDEILSFLQEQNLKWREDHTNADCTYTRNYIRHRLLPTLQQNCTCSIVERLSQLSQQAHKLNRLVREHTEKIWAESAKTDENNIALNLKRFLPEPKIVKVELIRRSITGLGSGERDLTQRHYEKILQLSDKTCPEHSRKSIRGGKVELPGGFVVWRETDNLIFTRPQRNSIDEKQENETINLEVPGQTRFGRYLIESTLLDAELGKGLTAENTEDAEKKLKFKMGIADKISIKKNSAVSADSAVKENFAEWFDLDRIKLPLVVRFRRKGDRFSPLGLAAEKKVGKFLTDAKVPQQTRKKTLVVADSEKIIWVWPIRISEQAKVTAGTKKVLQLRITDSK